MKILLVGASGAMGQVIENLIKKTNHEITLALQIEADEDKPFKVFVDMDAMSEYLSEHPETVNIIIDFSHASLTDEVVDFALRHQLPLMLATTGQDMDQVQQIEAASEKIAIVDAHNTSIGMTIMQHISAEMAKLLYPLGYDIEIIESHHRHKKDAPSGTAMMLRNSIIKVIDEQVNTIGGRFGLNGGRPHNEIAMHAIRAGNITGDHTILFANNEETIELTHRAGSKELFAKGAIQAGEFLLKAKPGLYNMQDVVGLEL